MSSANPKYKMTLSLSVLEHLGVNLYSSVPAVISETVANAWDADASAISIDIREESGDAAIVITDDGCGMTEDDINEKFLTVGYHRRVVDGVKTPRGRIPMGRKGIGKLSLFSIADDIRVYSRSGGQENAFLLDGEEIRKKIKDNKSNDYHPEVIEFDNTLPDGDGTRIVIRKLKKRVTRMTSKSLRKRLARRFGIRCTRELTISLLNNGESDGDISVKDRDYFGKLEHLFQYDEGYAEFCQQLAETSVESRTARFGENSQYRVGGWIGLVPESTALVDDGENLNKISVMVREKLALEDIMGTFGFSSMFTRYVIGEIHADFLDIDGQEDIATSSRQSIIEDDPRYVALRAFMERELKHVRDERDRIKGESGEQKARSILPQPYFNEWLDEMGPDTRKKARKFFGNINRVANNEDEKRLFACGVQTFESLRLKDALDSLGRVSVENLPEFLKITAELDDLESSYYYSITRERLGVIRKLRKKVDEDAREKALQEYIFDHLWLLDPSWDRATELPSMEQAVTKEFDAIHANMTQEQRDKVGRADIKYRKAPGMHVIVELKRASVSVNHNALAQQVEKYRKALEKCLAAVAEGKQPEPAEVVCILGKKPSNWETPEDEKKGRGSLREQGIRVVTYSQLIHDAERAYSEYIQAQKKQGRVQRIIEKALGEDGAD